MKVAGAHVCQAMQLRMLWRASLRSRCQTCIQPLLIPACGGTAPAQAEAGAEAGEAQGAGPAPPAEEDSQVVRAALGAAADAL